MKKEILKRVALALFEIQFEKQGLYGRDISFRFVTSNDYFQVAVFYQGVREKYVNVRDLDDVKKLYDLIWD